MKAKKKKWMTATKHTKGHPLTQQASTQDILEQKEPPH